MLHIINFPSNILQILQHVKKKQKNLPNKINVIAAPTRTSSPSISKKSSPLTTYTPTTRSTTLLIISSYPISTKSPLQKTKKSLINSNITNQKIF